MLIQVELRSGQKVEVFVEHAESLEHAVSMLTHRMTLSGKIERRKFITLTDTLAVAPSHIKAFRLV